MQMWRGKAWEIWSRDVTSCRQRVDTQPGAVPDDRRISEPFLVLSVRGLEAKVLARQHQYTVRHSWRQGRFNMKQELLL